MALKPRRTRRTTLLGRCCEKICCAGGIRKRRAAAALRAARERCVRLVLEAEDYGEQDITPMEHLRAAEVHLASVEQWLIGRVGGERGRRAVARLQGVARSEKLAADLGMTNGLAESEDVRCFESTFFPPQSGEVLLRAFQCRVRSSEFRHAGTLYLSNTRLCFHSNTWGIEAQFAFPWSDTCKFRLVSAENSRIFVSLDLKTPTMFDGAEVKTFELLLYGISDLGHVHRCATYFTGTGLFGMWTTPLGGDHSPPVATIKRQYSRKLSHRDTMTFKDIEERCVAWQLQRRSTVFQDDWRPPFLPHDGQKQIGWVAFEDELRYVQHPFIPKDMDDLAARASIAPPIPEVEFLGQMRLCSWEVEIGIGTDDDGWQYAVDFYHSPDQWADCVGWFSHVRRRKWKPRFDAKAGDVGDAGDDSEQVIARMSTTILDSKPIQGHPPLVEVDIGEVPLGALASAIEADDWQLEGSLMSTYFRDTGATNLDVGPWASGDRSEDATVAAVKGKVRSVDFVQVLDPKPFMCPDKTHIHSTWHVVSTDVQVVVESVSMSLDVPYGTDFNVIVCDTFRVDAETGHTKMVRTYGLEWVNSIMWASMVEAKVPEELTKGGHLCADVVARWAQQHGRPASLDRP